MDNVLNNVLNVLQTWWQETQENLPKVVAGVLVLLLFILLARILSRAIGRVLERRKKDKEIAILLTRIVRWSVIVLGVILALEQAGVFAIVLEKIPSSAAKKVTEAINVPTIGIGAGPLCDGQILVTHDILGLFEKFRPRVVRVYSEMGRETRESCARYVEDVKVGSFPRPEESY